MNLNTNSIISADELALDVDLIRDKLSESSELIVFENNQPQFVILTTEQYDSCKRQAASLERSHAVSGAQSVVKIGRLVQESLRKLFYTDRLPESEVFNLTSLEYSNDVFGLSFPVLKEVDSSHPFEDQKRDANGYNRYYNFTLTRNNKQYLLCSQWIERLHRERFELWLKQWEV